MKKLVSGVSTMCRYQLTLILSLIIHGFFNSANASTSEACTYEETEEADFIKFHITHQKHPGMRELGYLKLSLFNGETFFDCPTMNIHSSTTKSRKKLFSKLKKRPVDENRTPINYAPGSLRPKIYEKTYKVPRAYLVFGGFLCLSFYQENIDFKGIFDPISGKIIRRVTMFLWQDLKRVKVHNFSDILERHDGSYLYAIYLDIDWNRFVPIDLDKMDPETETRRELYDAIKLRAAYVKP